MANLSAVMTFVAFYTLFFPVSFSVHFSLTFLWYWYFLILASIIESYDPTFRNNCTYMSAVHDPPPSRVMGFWILQETCAHENWTRFKKGIEDFRCAIFSRYLVFFTHQQLWYQLSFIIYPIFILLLHNFFQPTFYPFSTMQDTDEITTITIACPVHCVGQRCLFCHHRHQYHIWYNRAGLLH